MKNKERRGGARQLKCWIFAAKFIVKRFFITFLTATTLLAGCGNVNLSTTRAPIENDAQTQTNTAPVLEESDLEYGYYYIKHGESFYAPYENRASFEQEDVVSSPDPYRVLWYDEDFENIPTLYEGDSLIFKTNENLDREFVFERFRYIGYTVGICNLTETNSGRFYFSSDPNGGCLCEGSDADRLNTMDSNVIVIDRIGNGDLRSGNVEEGGVIIGLSQDKSYAADLYIGSNLHEENLVADVIAMSSMEVQTTYDYTYLRSKIIEIPIPDSFNSGYYRIGDAGVFRYVKGTSFDESTDFNVENANEEDIEEDDAEATEESISDDTVTPPQQESGNQEQVQTPSVTDDQSDTQGTSEQQDESIVDINQSQETPAPVAE